MNKITILLLNLQISPPTDNEGRDILFVTSPNLNSYIADEFAKESFVPNVLRIIQAANGSFSMSLDMLERIVGRLNNQAIPYKMSLKIDAGSDWDYIRTAAKSNRFYSNPTVYVERLVSLRGIVE